VFGGISSVLEEDVSSTLDRASLSPRADQEKIILPSLTGQEENSTTARSTIGKVTKELCAELTILGMAAEPLKTSRTLEFAEDPKIETEDKMNM
jgi:hypothetical protein